MVDRVVVKPHEHIVLRHRVGLSTTQDCPLINLNALGIGNPITEQDSRHEMRRRVFLGLI